MSVWHVAARWLNQAGKRHLIGSFAISPVSAIDDLASLLTQERERDAGLCEKDRRIGGPKPGTTEATAYKAGYMAACRDNARAIRLTLTGPGD